MPRSTFPEISIEETERSKNGKWFKEPGGEHIKNHGQEVICPSQLLNDSYARARGR